MGADASMPRYFFNIRAGQTIIRDEEGVDLPDLAAVRWEAQQGARGFAAGECDQVFEVTNERGETVFLFSFAEARARS